MHPLEDSLRQILILRYLTSLVAGVDQELLVHMIQRDVLDLILNYVNVDEIKDSRVPWVSFEALKLLGALLAGKRFALKFIYLQGLHQLIRIPRLSIAATVRFLKKCFSYFLFNFSCVVRVFVLELHRQL